MIALRNVQAAPTVMPEKRANATLCKHTFLKWLRSGILTKTQTPQWTILLGQTSQSGGRLLSGAAGSRPYILEQTDG